MKNSIIIFRKQVKDTGRNLALGIQFIMFPLMAVIMENAIQVENMPPHFFVGMFAVMHIGMAPLNVMAAVISEEKEKNTLRMLFFGSVKPVEYLLGIGGFVFSACMAGTVVFAVVGGYGGVEFLRFLLIMAAGICVSMLLGAVIGILTKSQISATTIATPTMMVFAFLPMLAMFNETIAKVADYAYSQQVQLMLNGLASGTGTEPKSLLIIAVSAVIAAGMFIYAYRRSGLL
ncbi:MAG: ABC transporter permease [Lachnospiraceae bacterium]|nr:ABC transporter permease [Lachnospiraceae bacterium]MBD5502980.1 ABC transporter permease [Lachnospiraceae bacterium]MBD5506252.1 ABC transporter permease [Lachnospiraceae bacterium]